MIRERSGCTCQFARWLRDRVACPAATSATPPGVGASVPRQAEFDSDLQTTADSALLRRRAWGRRGAKATVSAVTSSPAQENPTPQVLRRLDTLTRSWLAADMRPIIRIQPPSNIRGAETGRGAKGTKGRRD